jgi:hypothetical protein
MLVVVTVVSIMASVVHGTPTALALVNVVASLSVDVAVVVSSRREKMSLELLAGILSMGWAVYLLMDLLCRYLAH